MARTETSQQRAERLTLSWMRRATDPQWICMVADSGLHNDGCRPNAEPDDQHDPSWECGWYWRMTFKANKPRWA